MKRSNSEWMTPYYSHSQISSHIRIIHFFIWWSSTVVLSDMEQLREMIQKANNRVVHEQIMEMMRFGMEWNMFSDKGNNDIWKAKRVDDSNYGSCNKLMEIVHGGTCNN